MKYLILLISIGFLLVSKNAKEATNEENRSEIQQVEPERKTEPDTFKSLLNEPWIKVTYEKNVFFDFGSPNAYKLEKFSPSGSEAIHIISIWGSEKLNTFFQNEGLFTNLEALKIANTKIDKAIFEKIIEALSTKQHFKKLILFNCEIREVPESISRIENLNTLDLSRNQIEELPNSITNLSHLNYLRLYQNKSFSKFPVNIGDLKELELLDFAGTSVEKIPSSIGLCKKLNHITGNASKVNALPKEIENCESLLYINLSYNSITEIPDELGNLPLESLSLGSNQIKSIPESISNLKNLWSLSFDNNDLASFPKEVLELKKLVNLHLHGNNIKEIPIELADIESLVSLIVDDRQELKPFIEAIKQRNTKVKITERKD